MQRIAASARSRLCSKAIDQPRLSGAICSVWEDRALERLFYPPFGQDAQMSMQAANDEFTTTLVKLLTVLM
jgi:hypothetical protein